MIKIAQLPPYKYREQSMDDDDNIIRRKIFRQDVICLPDEYEDYFRLRKLIYCIHKSHSNFAWNLSVNDGTWSDTEPGYYVKTLVLCRNGDFYEALNRAKKFLPEEPAFWVEDGYETYFGPLPARKLQSLGLI